MLWWLPPVLLIVALAWWLYEMRRKPELFRSVDVVLFAHVRCGIPML
jgi:hypothetical protein